MSNPHFQFLHSDEVFYRTQRVGWIVKETSLDEQKDLRTIYRFVHNDDIYETLLRHEVKGRLEELIEDHVLAVERQVNAYCDDTHADD